jgi:hypothetical protein
MLISFSPNCGFRERRSRLTSFSLRNECETGIFCDAIDIADQQGGPATLGLVSAGNVPQGELTERNGHETRSE